MKNLLKTAFLIFTVFLFLTSCRSENENPTTQNPTISLPISGSYAWKFSIPAMGEQTSMHNFSNEVIGYTMSGSAYTVNYDMLVKSYETDKKKIITKGKEGSPKAGKYFVIFLKDITTNSVTIYKAEVADEDAAKNYVVPADTDTQNHGWNVYNKK